MAWYAQLAGAWAARIAAALIVLGISADASRGQTPAFVPPPRTIADITAILDQEKSDPARLAKLRADADASAPDAGNRDALGQFYFRRAQARASLGRTKEAIADCEKAIEIGGDFINVVSRYQQFVSNQYRIIGDVRRSIEIEEMLSRKFEQLGRGKGRFFGSNLRSAQAYLAIGDIAKAEAYVAKNRALIVEARNWRNFDQYGSQWQSQVENGNGRVLAARGRYQEAEAAYRKAQLLTRDAQVKSVSWSPPPQPGSFESTIDFLTAFEGVAKVRQRRLAEGELDIRRALLSRLKAVGKYNTDTAQMITMLANLMGEQARYAEAEKLARAAVEIYRSVGYSDEVPVLAGALNQVASTLFSQRHWEEAGEIYTALDEATKNWDPARRAGFRLGWARIFNNYYTRKVDEGIELARAQVERSKQLRGEKHFDYAMARATLGAGLAYARRDAEALSEFQIAMPVLLTASVEGEDDDGTVTAGYDTRRQVVIESYLALLARMPNAGNEALAESFRLGEAIRGGSVQRALAASSARATARDPALADLVRKGQDLEKQVAAQLGAINNMLALPPGERDDKGLRDLQTELDKLRAARTSVRREIERKFPNYADLVSPKPATIEEIRAALRPDEAFVSLYFGRRSAFVWVVPKQGQIRFAATRVGPHLIEQKIHKLRQALEPQAAMIADIPPFDVALAHEIYGLLLQPVEPGWQSAKSLIVVTNGALGLLPLGLLPTAPVQPDAGAAPMFAGYRDVAWLARTHAVTSVPSAAAFRTLRRLPPGSAKRDKLIAFGDPYFSREQMTASGPEAPAVELAATTRGMPLLRRNSIELRGVDSADISLLPRLPDTADELKSIALALEADPAKVLHLGADANEQAVKTAELSKFKVLVFATHGLVAGDLNGLTQPALALSAPAVTGGEGDGLLTMEEILALRLDADWVVLSACNTGAAAGAGAEAASGLGRAFFYAGTRAILVTNWSVHSASARELVTDLFRRQAADPKLTRAEALRQAMMALLDGPGSTGADGKTMFSYAHPLFWAPYTIIGDGGGAL